MSRSSFYSRATSSRDQSPLLPQHTPPISLRSLSPRGASSRASLSPPPSFYRDNNSSNNAHHTFEHVLEDSSSRAYSPSPSRIKSPRTIQFAAPPPPITASVYLPKSAARSPSASGPERKGVLRRANSGPPDPLVALEKKEKAIQQELQTLLDAQSAGLVQGFGGNTGDGASDAGSSTPTMRSGGSSPARKKRSVVPVRQPKRKTITLKSARMGLGKDMEELIGVKDEEISILNAEMQRREEALSQVHTWEIRIETVRSQLSGFSGGGEQSLGGGDEAMEVAELQSEDLALQNEIRECEERLQQMRARQKWLKEKIEEGVNRREARLSSYRGALKDVEQEVGDFLKRPPVERSVIMGEQESFTALPVQRRTLGMAKEWWEREIEALKLRKVKVKKERKALEDGESMWADCVDVVSAFEDDLRAQMKSEDTQDHTLLSRQVEKMKMVTMRLSDHAQTAESKGWNLLICAVGAELAAFQEGERILKDALGLHENVNGNNGVGDEEGEREESFHSLEDDSFNTELLGLKLNGQETNLNLAEGKQPGLQEGGGRSESEDESEGPDLSELLVERSVSRTDSTVD